MTQILNTLRKEIEGKYQQFNPMDHNHQEAYYMLRYNGKQHPNYRFFLEEPFQDVVSMMQTKLSEAFLQTQFTRGSHSFKVRG